jgi:phosphatidylglycerophosphatase A
MSEAGDQPGGRPEPRLLASPVQFLAFGFGSGLAPRAPGTFGTLAGLLPYLLLSRLSWESYAAVVFLAALAGIAICGRASRELGVHDHGGIVWDEFVGLWIALFALPVEPLWTLGGFLAFRAFDILKPWPISWLDRRVSGGLGIMIDDIVAGILACALLHAMRVWVFL